MSLTDQLIDAWAFSEGAGATAAGAMGRVNLALGRTDQFSGDPISTGGGWTTEPGGRKTYNGGGVAMLAAAGYTLLAATGQAVTLAARIWLGGGMSVQPSYDSADPCMLMGLRGHSNINDFGDSAGWRLYTGAGALLANVIIEGVPGALFIPDWEISAGSPPAYSQHLFVVTVERLVSSERIRLAVDGVFKSEVVNTSGVGYSAPSIASMGCIHWARGSISQAAIWQRLLSDGEVTGMGSDLDDVLDAADEYTLLDGSGNARVILSYPSVGRVDAAVLSVSEAATGQVRVDRREANQRRPRRYTLRVRLAGPQEADVWRRAITDAAMGCAWLRFRHPEDDAPGSPETAPRYLIGDGSVTVRRAQGQSLELEIDVEEIVT